MKKAGFLVFGTCLLLGCGTSLVPKSAAPIATASPIATPESASTSGPERTDLPRASEAWVVPSDGCAAGQFTAVVDPPSAQGSAVVKVRRLSGALCGIRITPPASITDGSGRTLADSWRLPGDTGFYPLETELAFDLSWAVVCPAQTIVRPLSASIGFVDPGNPTQLPLPDGFEPACTLSAPVMGFDAAFSYGGQGGEGGIGG